MDLALVTSGYAAGDRAPCKALLVARDLNAHWRRYVLPFASPLQTLQLVDDVNQLALVTEGYDSGGLKHEMTKLVMSAIIKV